MSDPKYNTYAGELRFDDDNIVDVNLEPDTENITVRLNGVEISGGSELPEVTSSDNGDVLMVVEGVWAKADPPTELPAVTSSDNGDVLTVVEGVWAKAAPAGKTVLIPVSGTYDDQTGTSTVSCEYTAEDIVEIVNNGNTPIAVITWSNGVNEHTYCTLSMIDETEGSNRATFYSMSYIDQSGGVTHDALYFQYDSFSHQYVVQYAYEEYTPTPV